MVEAKAKYKRVLLKLSGEAFGGQKEWGIEASVLTNAARQIKRVMEMGVEVVAAPALSVAFAVRV